MSGDQIEYVITVEVSPPGHKGSMWIKLGCNSKVQQNETSKAAVDRVSKLVEDNLDRKVTDLMSQR